MILEATAALGAGVLPQLEATIAVIAGAPMLDDEKKEDLICQATKQYISHMAE